jgi:hypothetical protein
VAVPIASLAGPLPVAAIAGAWGLGMASIALSNTYWETNLQRRIPRGVFARVRSYDILVSFVFMPLGFITFPLIARSLGDTRTLLASSTRGGLSHVTRSRDENASIEDEPAGPLAHAPPNPRPPAASRVRPSSV